MGRVWFSPCVAGRAADADCGIDIWTIDTAHSGTASAANNGAAAVSRNEDASTNRFGGIACIGRERQAVYCFLGNVCAGPAYCCFAVAA